MATLDRRPGRVISRAGGGQTTRSRSASLGELSTRFEDSWMLIQAHICSQANLRAMNARDSRLRRAGARACILCSPLVVAAQSGRTKPASTHRRHGRPELKSRHHWARSGLADGTDTLTAPWRRARQKCTGYSVLVAEGRFECLAFFPPEISPRLSFWSSGGTRRGATAGVTDIFSTIRRNDHGCLRTGA